MCVPHVSRLLILALALSARAELFELMDLPALGADSTDSRSVALIDLNGDGRLDLFFSNSSHEDSRVFLGGSETGFELGSSGDLTSSGGRSDGASFADVDGDGDLDAAIVNWYGDPTQLFRNEGNGQFSRITSGPVTVPGSYSETCSWADVNGDGWLDLYISNSGGSLQNQLFLNSATGDVEFESDTMNELVQWQGHSRAVAFMDWTMDGQIDLAVSNEGSDTNQAFTQQQPGNWQLDFTSQLYQNSNNTMTMSWGDVDNDGDPDLFLGNHGQTDQLYRASSSGDLVLDSQPGFLPDTRSFGSAFGDLDNDGDLDLVVTQGHDVSPTQSFHDVAYRNDGNGNFAPWVDSGLDLNSGWSYGCALADLDEDGFLDLVTARWQAEHQPNLVWRNRLSTGHWIQFDLVGIGPNTTAIGAKIRVFSSINGSHTVQTRWVEGQTGYCGQVLRQHVGLGESQRADSVVVTWPDGTTDRWLNVPTDQRVQLLQGGGDTALRSGDRGPLPIGFILSPVQPNPFNSTTRITWTMDKVQHVSIHMMDLRGRTLRCLAAGLYPVGNHSLSLDGTALSSGLYLVTVRAGDHMYWQTASLVK